MNGSADQHKPALAPPASKSDVEIGQCWIRVADAGLSRLNGTHISIPCQTWTVADIYTAATGGDHAVLVSAGGGRRTLSCALLRGELFYRRA